MKLYTLLNAAGVVDEDFGEFEVDADGSIEVPEDLGARLHAAHIGGQKAWETEAERHARLKTEDLERRRDPAALYDLLAGHTAAPAETDPDAFQAAVDAAVDAKVQAAVDEAVAKALEAQTAGTPPAPQAPAATPPVEQPPAKPTRSRGGK